MCRHCLRRGYRWPVVTNTGPGLAGSLRPRAGAERRRSGQGKENRRPITNDNRG
jgi:hypothetical protein